MKKDLTEIVFILDESGSMHELKADTIGGFNSLIEKQKKEDGEAFVSTVMFNTSSHVVHDRVSLGKIKNMTSEDYCPNGGTALLDAIGDAVCHIKNIHKYAREEDIPEHTLFVITTDGMENSSRKYRHAEIKKMIEAQQEKGWEFIFLGANIDAAETAESIGICRETAVNYHSDCVGTAALFNSLHSAIKSTRSGEDLRNSSVWRSGIDSDFKKRKR